MIRIGIISPADIAERRFLPALEKCSGFVFAGAAVCADEERETGGSYRLTQEQLAEKRDRQTEKAEEITSRYGGKIYDSYFSLAVSGEIDAVYIPLPPALHYKWAKICLENGKHVLLEKPFTTNWVHTNDLLNIAGSRKLAVNENYMFIYHGQVDAMKRKIMDGSLGEIRLYEAMFGFPKREPDDFRYKRFLGGGALFDCGGYLLKCASVFWGDEFEIIYASAGTDGWCETDLYGCAALAGPHGEIMNIAYGMDNAYQCEMRVWGSKAVLSAERFFTPPPRMQPAIRMLHSDGLDDKILVPACDTFQESIKNFEKCIHHSIDREKAYNDIQSQAMHMEEALLKTGLMEWGD